MFQHQINLPQKKVKNLVIFLHGYNDSISNHQTDFEVLCHLLPDSIIAMPQSPELCDKNPRQHQWFGMLKYDPQSLRTQPQTSVTQIFKIYQKAAASIDLCAQNINAFIDKLQQKYNIDNSHTYLIGFSQGAMLTIYTSISRSHTIGGAFALSGLAAGHKLLATKITARPKLYLFHGLDDLKVQYKTVKSTVQWLKRHNMQPKVFTYAGLTHHVTALELEKICSIINNTTQKL